jgi:3-hydroxyisobutyrate dehydrogenase-like beta-hydroxyacid dehydrogenase
MTVTEPRRVGVIGLGTMGEGMAINLAKGAVRLSVYDLRPEPLERLAACGARATSSIEELARDCDVILVVVVDEVQANHVLVGSGAVAGVFGAAKPGTVVLVHSTIGVGACVRLGELAAVHGIDLIDAPITGAPAGARAGTLTVIAGGDAGVIERCEPVLALVAKRVVRVGDVGAGQLAKVANNLVFGATLNGVHEALELGAEVGLDPTVLLQVLASGAAQSWIVENWQAIGESSRDYPGGPAGVAKLTRKDLALALAAGHEQGLALPGTALAAELLGEAYAAAARYADHLPERA